MKYRRGCVWRVLQANGVFGEKVATDSVHNILINNKGKKLSMFLRMFIYTLCTGLKDTNVEGDLVVEHYNKAFKVIFFDMFVISCPPPLLGDLGEPEG